MSNGWTDDCYPTTDWADDALFTEPQMRYPGGDGSGGGDGSNGGVEVDPLRTGLLVLSYAVAAWIIVVLLGLGVWKLYDVVAALVVNR